MLDGSSDVSSQGCRTGEGQPFRNFFSLSYCILLHCQSVLVRVQLMNICLSLGRSGESMTVFCIFSNGCSLTENGDYWVVNV